MSNERKPSLRRGEIAFIFAIVLGLVLGILIKKIRIGMLVGVILGVLIIMTGWTRTKRK